MPAIIRTYTVSKEVENPVDELLLALAGLLVVRNRRLKRMLKG